jgi:hypothetical protein
MWLTLRRKVVGGTSVTGGKYTDFRMRTHEKRLSLLTASVVGGGKGPRVCGKSRTQLVAPFYRSSCKKKAGIRDGAKPSWGVRTSTKPSKKRALADRAGLYNTGLRARQTSVGPVQVYVLDHSRAALAGQRDSLTRLQPREDQGLPGRMNDLDR